MAYEKGTYSSPTDLLQKLVTWLTARGWTVNMSQADGTGWRAHVSKGAVYANLRSTPGGTNIFHYGAATPLSGIIGIGLNVSSGFSSGSAWYAQPGVPVDVDAKCCAGFTRMPVGAGIEYHFFDDGQDNIFVVLENTANVFTYLGFGNLIKTGTWTGGAYSISAVSGYWAGISDNSLGYPGYTAWVPGSRGAGYSDYACNFVRADVDTFTGKWLGIAGSTSNNACYTGKKGMANYGNSTAVVSDIAGCPTAYFYRQASQLSNQFLLFPINWYAEREASNWSLLGRIPSVYASYSANFGHVPYKGVETVDGDTYMFFPYFAVKKVL